LTLHGIKWYFLIEKTKVGNGMIHIEKEQLSCLVQQNAAAGAHLCLAINHGNLKAKEPNFAQSSQDLTF